MKNPKAYRKWIIFFSIVLSVLLCPIKSAAYERPHVEENVSVTISAEIQGARFQLYRIAELSDEVQFKLTDEFCDYQVELDLNHLNQESWKTAATTFAGYVMRDNIQADVCGITDQYGNLTIENLSAGLYLIIGNEIDIDTVIRKYNPFMICLPNLTEDLWEYAPVVVPKYESQEKPAQISCQVQKIWKDNNYSGRPKKVVVQLLDGSNVYEEVTLSKENNWRYVWEKLPAKGKWCVVEKNVPENYTVAVEKDGNSFIVMNSKNSLQPPSGSGNELPQTGQLWWPVPILLVVGILLLLVGIKKGRKE